ncbi:MAG TPA: YhdP family protein, partial [Rheinheimera sp.]|nr:YhdP family protein [Rheinheimera sp.]
MHKVTRVCFYCLHKLWLTLAGVLVLLAVLVSVLRYSLPYADNYKLQIEQLISERYGTKVEIGALSAGWQKYGPALLLNDVKLFDSDELLQISIDETRVRLDFWRSLLSWQLTAQHFELSGLTYYLDSSSLLARDDNTSLDPAPVLDALGQLFFQQLAYFSVVDSQLIIKSDSGPQLQLNILQLDWLNSGNRHQGNGQLSLPGVTANTVSFVLDLYGPSLSEAFGQLYLESEQLDVLPWFARVLPPSQKLQQADINFKAWGRIDGGLLRRIQVELADNSLSWQRDGVAHTLHLGQGQLLWQPTAQGWSLTSGDLTLAAEDQQWRDLQLQLQQHDGILQGSLSNFRLEAVTPLANLLADDIALLQKLMPYQPNGHLQQLLWRMDDANWQVWGQFDQLQSQAKGDIPGLNGISGQFWGTDGLVKLQLSGEQGTLSWDGFFADDTRYDTLELTAYLQAEAEQQWRVMLPTISLRSSDLQLDASLQFGEQLSILARLQQADAAIASRYFPQRYMPQTVSRYLTSAIKQGQVKDAYFVWHGKPGEFPYTEQQGVFQVLAQLEQGEFEFAPDWPAIQQLDAELWFENASMQILALQGELAGVSVENSVSARIADLFHAETIDIHIQQQLEVALVTELMLQSPLAGNLGKTLQHLNPQGSVTGDVTLAIGLKQPQVRATGEVVLNAITLNLQAPQMQLDKVRGVLSFDNENIQAEDLHLVWRGLSLNAAVQGKQADSGYLVELQLDGKQDSKQLMQALYAPAESLIDGQTAWQLQLALNIPQQGFNYSAHLTSSLRDTALLVPAPYQKSLQGKALLSVTAHGDVHSSVIAAHYNDNLHFHAQLLHDSQTFSRVQVTASEQDTGLNGAGFVINLDVAELSFLPWFEILQQQLAQTESGNSGLFPPLTAVRGKVQQLTAAPGILLNNTVFELTQQQDAWLLQLNGTEIASRWQLSKDWQQQGITLALDYLHLPWPEFDETEHSALTAQRWLLQLPPLSISCNDCSVGNYQFGKVTAKAISTADQWQLIEFEADYKRHRLSATGYWQDDAELGQSLFSGNLSSPNLGAMLSEYQITSAISGSKADIAFNLSWPGAPTQFMLDGLAGDINYSLGEGSLTEVSDQGARLFSIFSLDSLLRKLRLDFRDVFAKGFFYNNMKGNLAVTQGVVQTNDA